MNVLAVIPDHETQEFGLLSTKAQAVVTAYLLAAKQCLAEPKLWPACVVYASRPGATFSAKTLHAKLSKFRKTGDWRVFIDTRFEPAMQKNRERIPVTKNAAFIKFLQTLSEKHNRSSARAWDDLIRQWERREPIDGYEGWPGWPNIPDGWSARNLFRQQSTKPERKAYRIGVSAAAGSMPQVFSTRVGRYVGSHYVFDDLRVDNFVTFANQVCRVDELDCLDYFSACKFAWGYKPRWRKADGTEDGLKEANMRFLLASVLFNTGYSPRGTVLMAENGTAAIRERMEEILQRISGGAISVSRSGITGEDQAVLGMWKGQGKGNPRHKAPLESLRNMIHNYRDALPGQTGRNVDHRPEMLYGLLEYQSDLLEAATKLPPEQRAKLRMPLLEYHSQFVPLADELTENMNGRTSHVLEGWHKSGLITIDYRHDERSCQWLTEDDFLALPPADQALITDLVHAAPKKFSRVRRLSPREVHKRAANELIRIAPYMVCEMLGEDLARKNPEPVRGSYFDFEDCTIDPEPLIYEARIITLDGREQELPSDSKWQVFVNPFDPDQLFVRDAAGRYQGMAPRYQRVNPFDRHEVESAFGRKKQRTAERFAGLRERHAPEVAELEALRAHNDAVIAGQPATPEERSQARDTARRIQREPATMADLLSASCSEPAPDDYEAPSIGKFL
jgi:hypothetical protein